MHTTTDTDEQSDKKLVSRDFELRYMKFLSHLCGNFTWLVWQSRLQLK
jgi:hypothetical protein